MKTECYVLDKMWEMRLQDEIESSFHKKVWGMDTKTWWDHVQEMKRRFVVKTNRFILANLFFFISPFNPFPCLLWVLCFLDLPVSSCLVSSWSLNDASQRFWMKTFLQAIQGWMDEDDSVEILSEIDQTDVRQQVKFSRFSTKRYEKMISWC